MSTPRTKMCPCCGHPSKHYPNGQCRACWFVFDEGHKPERRRQQWVENGMLWMSNVKPQPKQWNPLNNLARLALATTRARTKGRPPRMN